MGAVTAERFARAGYRVMIGARRAERVAALAARLDVAHGTCDITVEAQVERLAARAIEHFGRLDCAVNMVGQAVMGDIASTSESQLRRSIDVHFVGTFFFFKHMAAAIDRDGAMVTTSSLTASRVINNHAAYVAAKAGADHLMRIAAVEYGPRNIRVNSVSPGFTPDTPMSRDFAQVEGLVEMFEQRIPLGRLNSAADIAHAVLWLCDPATYVTGENLQVNGGNALTGLPGKSDFVALMKSQKK
jgi:NAD(P)-dependent dehydrogenase (short-subunit alcohol dehydrogenase family)